MNISVTGADPSDVSRNSSSKFRQSILHLIKPSTTLIRQSHLNLLGVRTVRTCKKLF